MYVLQHIETGRYVAKPGSLHSYTMKLERAQVFKTYSEAVRNSCTQSERALSLGSALAPLGML